MDKEILLQEELNKCLTVIKKYNLKYKTIEHQRLLITHDYLVNLLETETEDYKKNILIEDISIIKSYLV
jgi:hypothetical protein